MRRRITCLGMLGLGLFAALVTEGQTNPPPTRVALISTCAGEEGANAVALAVAALSGNEGVTLVERDAVERILQEQNLWRCGLSEARQALAVGRLLGVDVFIAVEAFAGTKGLPGLVAFDARSGVRLWDVALTSTNIPTQAAEIAAAVRGACGKRTQLGARARTVCVLAVRNAGLPREMNSACEAAGRLLEQQLLASPDLAVLERQRLEQINQERSLPGISSSNDLRLALTLLDLEISRTPDGKGFQGVVFLTAAGGTLLGRVSTNLMTETPARLSEALLPELLKALHSEASGGNVNRGSEAQRFVSESQFLLNDGDLPGALRMAEAAAALDPDSSSVQIQLAACLCHRANAVLAQGGGDVKSSLPIAARALEIFRQERLKPTTEKAFAEQLFASADNFQGNIFGGRDALDQRFWPSALALFEKQDRDTKNDLLGFQLQLREVKLRLGIQYWRSRITNGSSAKAYGEVVNDVLCQSELLSPSSAIWTTDMAETMAGWLEVFDQYPLGWGGWELSPTRTMANVCWRANDCATPPTRLGRWQLQPEDLEKFARLFQQMEQHRNPIVQCYGHIGRLALSVRGQKELTLATQQQYNSAKAFIRTKISELASLPVQDDRRFQSYSAARDLIDILPDADFRRWEHLDLFEWMLERRDVAYWTAFMAVSPDACRFAQYHLWPQPFSCDPVGYGVQDYPMLHTNRLRLLALYNSTNRHDLDAARMSFREGSFPREVAAMCGKIYVQRPDLAESVPATLPWKKAETIFDAMPMHFDAGIIAVLTDETAAYAVVDCWKNNGRWGECYRIPLDGKAPTLFGVAPLSSKIRGITGTALTSEALYIGVPEVGVFGVPLNGGAVQKFNHETGLLSDHVGVFTVVDDKLYTQLNEGHLVVLNLHSHRCDILAAKRSKEKRSPLDETETGFEIPGMFPDPARHRVLFTTRFKGDRRNCFPLTGLWQIDTLTGKLKQLLALHHPAETAMLNDSDHLLLYGRRNGDSACYPPFENIVSYELSSDTARVVWVFNGKRNPVGPTLVGDERTLQHSSSPRLPFLITDGWLWLLTGGYLRLSLNTSEIQEFSLPEAMSVWNTLYQLPNGKQILAANKKQIYLLTLPGKSSKDSPP